MVVITSVQTESEWRVVVVVVVVVVVRLSRAEGAGGGTQVTCQPRSRPGVGGMKRGRELADGRQTQQQQARKELQLLEHLADRR
jgi:hypothetical protein